MCICFMINLRIVQMIIKKVDNKFYFYFSEALNYKHYQAFFVFFCLFYIMRVLILYAKNHNLNNHNWSCGVTLLKI